MCRGAWSVALQAGVSAMSASAPAHVPCASCPYRLDVPSGLWDRSEYEKLPAYDRETHAQPTAPFFCHRRNGRLCSGWCGTHRMGESLGLRVGMSTGTIDSEAFEAALEYVSPVPLHESGLAAAEHGKAEIAVPGARARTMIKKLESRR